jgi:hypothetical protein
MWLLGKFFLALLSLKMKAANSLRLSLLSSPSQQWEFMTPKPKPISLSTFRETPDLINAQIKLQDSRAFKQLMEVLMAELPSRHALPHGSSPQDFACAHGLEVGYLRCIETMKLMAEPAPAGEPVASFEDEDYRNG